MDFSTKTKHKTAQKQPWNNGTGHPPANTEKGQRAILECPPTTTHIPQNTISMTRNGNYIATKWDTKHPPNCNLKSSAMTSTFYEAALESKCSSIQLSVFNRHLLFFYLNVNSYQLIMETKKINTV